jgi:PPOX class probable F420-dependent enzyme
MASKRSRITAFTDAIYLRMRHRDAWTSARTTERARGFGSLRGRSYCLLTTFRRNGEPMPTPVWFGLGGENVYLRSEAGVGKVKRIRATPRVLVAPCTLRGKPLGPPAEGRARVMDPTESEVAERAIAANYGVFRKVYEGIGNKLPSIAEVYIEIVPVLGGE